MIFPVWIVFAQVRWVVPVGLGWCGGGFGSGSAPRWLPAGIRLRRWHQHGLLQCRIAEALGLPVPGSGESVSPRLGLGRRLGRARVVPRHGDRDRFENLRVLPYGPGHA